MMLGTELPENSPVQGDQDSEDSEDLHIFEIANMEFEMDDKPTTEKPTTEKLAPVPSLKDFIMGEDSINMETETQVDVVSSSPGEPDGEYLQESLTSMMDEFKLDLCSVTQALLKNSGEVGSTRHFLRTGVRPDGYPIWEYKDDLDLQKNDSRSLTLLAEKYGVDNLARRLGFLGS